MKTTVKLLRWTEVTKQNEKREEKQKELKDVKAGLLQLQTKFELDTLKNMTDAMISPDDQDLL